MQYGTIVKALSGFYYVSTGGGVIECRARGKFRREGITPLVGDKVGFTGTADGKGTVDEICPRRNRFARPAVANVDYLVMLAAAVNPITDPYLIDRVTVVAESAGCDVIVCINKADLDPGDGLHEVYSTTGYQVLHTSAVTGEGLAELRRCIDGKIAAFTGNSGVGKSSVLNALDPRFNIKVGRVSEKLGRGRHTTRHVELFELDNGTYIADTPGFASFDVDGVEFIRKDNLQFAFREFAPYIGKCRFNDCAHLKEPDCAVIKAVADGTIHKSRHDSYARLYGLAAQVNDWEIE